MSMEPTSAPRNRWLWIVPAAIIVMICNVAVSILYMVVYSYLINPGRDMAHYQAHAQFSAPYSSIIAGFPLMFLVCRWIAKKFVARSCITAALLIWLVYFLIDMTAVVFAGGVGGLALILVISHATKFAAAYLGGLAARKQVAAL
jgi:hypothetical protein